MDAESFGILSRLIHGQRVGALGTLRSGAPHVSMAGFRRIFNLGLANFREAALVK